MQAWMRSGTAVLAAALVVSSAAAGLARSSEPGPTVVPVASGTDRLPVPADDAPVSRAGTRDTASQRRLRDDRRHARRRPAVDAGDPAAHRRPRARLHRRHLPAPAVLPGAGRARHRPVRPEQRRPAQRRPVRRLPGPRPHPRDRLVVRRGGLPDRLRRQVPQRLHRRGHPPVRLDPLGRPGRRRLRLPRLLVRRRRREPRGLRGQLRHRRDRRADQRHGAPLRPPGRALPPLLLAPRAALPPRRGQARASAERAARRRPLRRRRCPPPWRTPPSTSGWSSTSPARSATGARPTRRSSSRSTGPACGRCSPSTARSASLVDTLRETGELDDTVIVFTSDNGYSLGEHRFVGKNVLTDPVLQVPLLVRGPGIAPGTTSELPVTLVDLPATFAAIAGASPSWPVDGTSVVPTLRGLDQPFRDTDARADRRRRRRRVGLPRASAPTATCTASTAPTRSSTTTTSTRTSWSTASTTRRTPPCRAALEERRSQLITCAGRLCNQTFGALPEPG